MWKLCFYALGVDDYSLTMPMGLFQTGDTRACTSITLFTNTRVEGTEYFTVNLIGNSEVIINNTAASATVIIADDDGKLLVNSTFSCFPQPC